MATTPTFKWRIPLRTDKPAGATQITALATDIEATMLAPRPYGSISGGAAAQSIPANTNTKLTLFGGATPTLQGGVTWDAVNHRFVAPRGWYYVSLSLRVLSSASASVFSGYTGTGTAVGRGLLGHSLAAGASAFVATGGVVDSEDRLAAWVHSTVARNVDYAQLDVMFLSYR